MLLLIVFSSLFAHENLDSTVCKDKKETIEIKQINKTTYKIKTPGAQTAEVFKAPTVKDFWDPKNKQMFDTYTFKRKGFELVIKRPETKGPIKNKRAEWKSRSFTCQ